MAEHLSLWVSQYGIVAIFVLMTLESACIPIPSEAVVPYAGYLAYNHQLSFTGAVLTATAANVVGGWIAYLVGARGGRPLILRYGRYILLSERHLKQAERWFERHGEWTVFFGRMLPALRTFISLPAGIGRMNPVRFTLYSALGSLPWNFALAWAGWQLGKHWEAVGTYLKPLTWFGAAVLVVGVVWFWFGQRRRRRAG
ncbi:DedA family protein [Alicyclobacillus sp.]|uniref:DedA family protein n=1 Tax=Alicyclobacillus sp. TaxID=61169 RepID=UPI0025B8CA47|nr:DedA family protein [Alicyclobacillus sp.]